MFFLSAKGSGQFLTGVLCGLFDILRGILNVLYCVSGPILYFLCGFGDGFGRRFRERFRTNVFAGGNLPPLNARENMVSFQLTNKKEGRAGATNKNELPAGEKRLFMLSKNYSKNVNARSAIRELFEYSKARAAEIGAENVFDFSIGNPSVPSPECIFEAAEDILENEDPVKTHGYPSAEGIPAVRKAIAEELNGRFGTDYTEKNIFMTMKKAH